MNLRSWLDAERGRATALSAHLDVSLSRISQMADGVVATKYMLAVRDFTRGAVSLEEMVEARTPEVAERTASTTPAPTAPSEAGA